MCTCSAPGWAKIVRIAAATTSALPRGHPGQHVAHAVHPATLPGRPQQHRADRGLQPGVRSEITSCVVQAWRHWPATLPEQATTSFALLRLPAESFVPEPLAGRMSLSVRFLWTGEPEEGARLLDRMRAVAPLILDDAALKPYTAVHSVHADPVDPMPVIDTAVLLADFAAERLLEVAGYGSDSPQVMVEVRQLGGACAREPERPTAFCHRDARFSVLCVGLAAEPQMAEVATADAQRVFYALASWDNRVLVSACDVHAAIAQELTEPGALSV
jgi:hypothetical protein